MKRGNWLRTLAAVLLLGCAGVATAEETKTNYVVVISKGTQADAEWNKVAETLVAKHKAEVVTFDKQVSEVLPALTKTFPRYVCFVATPEEAGRQFVADVHRLTRKLDDDPYTDVQWGVLTGYDADNALRIAKQNEPLEIKRVASGTEVALDRVVEGIWYCELQKNRMVQKKPGEEAKQEKGPDDTTSALADTLSKYKADLFVTSGHATERDWQIGYSYRNGQFRSKGGQLFGVDTAGKQFAIKSDNPKVYLPIGNCLMGHIDGRDSMALAFMNSAGVDQMIGYTVLTWYGYAGWGCLDYFIEQPGRYTFSEAFAANEHALVHRLNTYFPELAKLDTPPGSIPRLNVTVSDDAKAAGLTRQDGVGLLHDRDVLAFYGDPAWSAKVSPGKLAYEQTLSEKDGVYTLEIKPLAGEKSFEPVNTNGAQRGWRPIVQLLPERIKDWEIVEGEELRPVVADDFVLVPNPKKCDPTKSYKVVFKAKKA